MRFGIIFGLTHDGKVEVVDGPANSTELNRDLKSIAGDKEHPKYSELHLHEIHLSGGRKRVSFAAPKDRSENPDPV